ncbi:MAG: hypothetical protein HDQ95_04605 [Roseburia sp.]|nr:hypothetical protein [Roseburia sp.]
MIVIASNAKDKKAKPPKDKLVIFKRTKEPIIDEEIWNKVQEL